MTWSSESIVFLIVLDFVMKIMSRCG